jgi:hypothetical protein
MLKELKEKGHPITIFLQRKTLKNTNTLFYWRAVNYSLISAFREGGRGWEGSGCFETNPTKSEGYTGRVLDDGQVLKRNKLCTTDIYASEGTNVSVFVNVLIICICLTPDPSGRTVKGTGLQPFDCWDCAFEYHRNNGCLSVVSVVCCQVEVSVSG